MSRCFLPFAITFFNVFVIPCSVTLEVVLLCRYVLLNNPSSLDNASITHSLDYVKGFLHKINVFLSVHFGGVDCKPWIDTKVYN